MQEGEATAAVWDNDRHPGELIREAEAPRTSRPMDVARAYVELTRRKRVLERDAKALVPQLEKLEQEVLSLIESGDLPHSFSCEGASLFTREQVWASARDGDHPTLAAALREAGLVEYLPSKVNSQSISAYVREFIDPETGELRIGGEEGLDQKVASALRITNKVNAVVNG